MNRVIKFRAYCKKRKKMYKVLNLNSERFNNGQLTWATVEGFNIIEQKEIRLQVQPENCALMQFTGLHDRNGKEIYEGDILEFKASKMVVEYTEKAITNCGCCNDVIAYGYDFSDFAQASECTIIGNVYENPELIETK